MSFSNIFQRRSLSSTSAAGREYQDVRRAKELEEEGYYREWERRNAQTITSLEQSSHAKDQWLSVAQ